jgi:aminodeoxychorismate lyase
MIVFLNGEFVPESSAVVSVFDRGFLYGDGLFETLRVCNGRPFRWEQHWERLQGGAAFLDLRLPFPSESLRAFAGQLLAKNQMPDALLRVTLSRGVGPRGYSPRGADQPTLTMSVHAAPAIDTDHPARWRLVTSSVRLPADDGLARLKTCNKLRQILARAEADAANADEALLLDTLGHVVEGSTSNLFWFNQDALCTPPLTCGILPGVTRAIVFELGRKLGLKVREGTIEPAALRLADGVFLSVSSVGLAEAVSLDGVSLNQSPWVERLHRAYTSLLHNETQ